MVEDDEITVNFKRKNGNSLFKAVSKYQTRIWGGNPIFDIIIEFRLKAKKNLIQLKKIIQFNRVVGTNLVRAKKAVSVCFFCKYADYANANGYYR